MQSDPRLQQMMQHMGLDRNLRDAARAMHETPGARMDASNPRGIPRRDQKKIAGVSRKVMSDNELKDYIKKVHGRIAGRISPQSRTTAEQILKEVRAREKSPAAIAMSAYGVWIAGHPEEAVYVMGVACTEDPTNVDKLNNYAAFITMSGAPDLALPILFKLDKKHPGNSTVLNNIGQAWFDLGDIEDAEKSLDAAIRVFAYHSQANDTKAMIEESSGNKATAITALKNSLQRSYSQSRMTRLEKLGGRLDVVPDWGFRMPQDALGLEKIVPPKYPKETGELAGLRVEWERFKGDVLQRRNDLKLKEAALDKAIKARRAPEEKRLEQAGAGFDLQALRRSALRMQHDFPPFYPKAMAKLRVELGAEGNGMLDVRMHRQLSEMHSKAVAETEAMKRQWAQEVAPIYKAMTDQTGEGLTNDDSPYCSQINAISDKYLGQINARFEEYGMAEMNGRRKEVNTLAYYLQYATPGGDDAVALMEIRQKLEYLGEMYSLPVHLEAPKCFVKAKYQKSGMGPLADFYDLHCDNKTSLSIPGVGSIKVECNKMTTDFSAGPISANWKENLDTGAIMKGSVEIGISASRKIGEISGEIRGGKSGPGYYDEPFSAELSAEVSIKTAAFIEFENGSISDFGAKLGASAGADASLIGSAPLGEIGIESRLGWNSGASTTGSGVLSGLSI